MKEANLKSLPTVWFQLYGILEKVKLWEQKKKDQWLPEIWGEGGWIGGTQGIFRSVVVRTSCTELLDVHKKELLHGCILVESCGIENNWRWALFTCTFIWLFKFCCSVAKSCVTICNPMYCSMPGVPVLYHLLEFAKLKSSESVMPSNHLLLCRPLLLLPSIFPSIRIFSNESALHIRWAKY